MGEDHYAVFWTIPPEKRIGLGQEERNLIIFSQENIARHDPVLVQVVEELGGAAASWGKEGELAIREIADGVVYRIDEYDDLETVMTPDDDVWIDPSAEGSP